MLDPWIIEEIRRREEEERNRERPHVEMPKYDAPPDTRERSKPEEENPRGVTIIDI